MLQKLHIQNYAIIDDLDIDFSGSLNIITGETGAGKSILMGALNLILGQRADSSSLLQTDKKCIVEGTFLIKKTDRISDFFAANDIEPEDEILVRREIAANGKSRSFVNDTPVNLSQLKALSVLMVDLHQQFDTLELNTENFQREVLDALAGNADLLTELKETFTNYINISKDLSGLKERQNLANKELDYNRFLLNELQEISLKENELENLDAEIRLLSNAESIKQRLCSIYFELKDSELPLVQQLKILQNKMHSLHEYHPDMDTLSKRLLSAVIEIQDIADELERIDDSVTFDPERIELINERLSAGYKLIKKHGVNDTAGLLDVQVELQQKVDAVLNISGTIEKLEQQVKCLYDECIKAAGIISENRSSQVKSFTANVNRILKQVGMPNATLKVQLRPVSLSVYGSDQVEFLFDANKSNRYEPVSKVASGGELSRLMLTIKSLVAKKLELPTLIFDEIDTGISGEAAKQVGIIMQNLSTAHQLIAITHQPQIAARASAHYFVYKEIKENKIVTSIRLLNNDERITTIAQMLGGEKPTAAALENAREMVRN